jgi:hypothetical protein
MNSRKSSRRPAPSGRRRQRRACPPSIRRAPRRIADPRRIASTSRRSRSRAAGSSKRRSAGPRRKAIAAARPGAAPPLAALPSYSSRTRQVRRRVRTAGKDTLTPPRRAARKRPTRPWRASRPEQGVWARCATFPLRLPYREFDEADPTSRCVSLKAGARRSSCEL